ncbi:tyrosine-type recombinase/integrase [Primorskyibacter sp. S87]|uniref:tyrosine-type recombinase/integrase n=1 Tax=Primorskyibacter sp. S87 TaxID=3415126 RepID=UPI003C7DE828
MYIDTITPNTAPRTLQGVIDLLKRSAYLDPTCRRDLVSAINRVADILNVSPDALPTDVPVLRGKLMTVHPVQAGLTSKSWSNIKSDLRRALVLANVIPETETSDRSPGWLDFLGKAKVKQHAWSLSRFVSFCMRGGTEPADVTDEVMDEFRAELTQTILSKDPNVIVKEMILSWNRILRDNSLDFQPLQVPTLDRYQTRPLEQYPKALQDDIRTYLERLSHADMFDESGPARALRPVSLRNTKAHIRQYLDALVDCGHQAASWGSLGQVLKPELVKQGFTRIVERNGGEPPVGLVNISATLLGIARHYSGAPQETVDTISAYKRKLVLKTGAGSYAMSEKNVTRLAQFDNWENIARLVALPDILMDRAKSNPDKARSALDAMYAVVISLLLCAPMRARNLAGLDLDKNFDEQGRGKNLKYVIHIEGADVKNNTPIDVVLNEGTARMLTTYQREFRSKLSEHPGGALFPKKSGGARSAGQLSGGISDLIYRETGLKVHTHLFRHFAAKLYLDAHPGDYETVRRLLGHRRLETTMAFYARLTNAMALDQYDKTVLSKLRGTR